MNPNNQQKTPNSEPQFDPTNPDKPIYLSGLPAPTLQPEQTPAPLKIKKFTLIRLVLSTIIFIAIAASSARHSTQNTQHDLNPPSLPSTSSPSTTGNLKVGNYSGADGINNQTTSQQATTAGPMSADDERKADINALHAQLESYYQLHFNYPTLNNMNDAVWLATKMQVNIENLRDPASSSYVLSAVHGKNTYSYSPLSATGGNCDNVGQTCVVYRLAAVLSDGALYTQDNLYAN